MRLSAGTCKADFSVCVCKADFSVCVCQADFSVCVCQADFSVCICQADFKFLLKNDKIAWALLHVWETCADQDSLSVTVTPGCFPLSTCSSIWLPSEYDLDNVFELEPLAILIILHLKT